MSLISDRRDRTALADDAESGRVTRRGHLPDRHRPDEPQCAIRDFHVFRHMRAGSFEEERLEHHLHQRGFMARLLRRATHRATKARHLYPVGLLMGYAACLRRQRVRSMPRRWWRLGLRLSRDGCVPGGDDPRSRLRLRCNTHVWKPALIASEVEPSRENGCHALRHFYASVLLDAGESIKAMSDYLGHSDLGFT